MEYLDFIEFLDDGYIAVKGHLNFQDFKKVAEEFLNLDNQEGEEDLFIVDDIRHLYGKMIPAEEGEEFWNWGYGQYEDNVIPVTVGEYYTKSMLEEETQEVGWEMFISNN